MDPNAVVLEISSDEEVSWDGHDGRGIIDGGDDQNWIAELLDEVNRDDCDYDCGYDDGGDDSDEVVLVSDVLPSKKPRKKLKSKSSSLIDLGDDCVVLDHDPDKPLEVRNDNPIDRDEDDDSDDLLVVGEKGQVACRDYPHSRHLCIKFPFSSTPNQSHCDQCYCYVCDSLAPCVYWGNGSASIDHCHATDKDEFWRLERKNSKSGSKGVQPVRKVADASLSNRLPPMNLVQPASATVQTPSVAHNQVLRPSPIRACPISSNIGLPNVINQNRSPFLLSRSKYPAGLVSRQLIGTSNCSNPRDRGHHNYNLGTPCHIPVFKRTGSAGVASTASQYSYSPCRDNYRNPHPPSSRNPCRRQDYCGNEMLSGPSKYWGSPQPNVANTSGPFSPPNLASSTVTSLLPEPLPSQPEFSHQPTSNTQFDFSPNFRSQVNSGSYVENPVLFQPNPISLPSQPHVVPSQPQGQPSHYSVPPEAPVDSPSIPIPVYSQNVSQQGNQAQSSMIDPNFIDYDICWPQSQTNHQTATETSQLEGTAPTNESSLATVSGGLVDYQYDNWIFDNQPCEPGSMDIPGSFGLNEFSPDPAFIGTGTLFDF